MAWRVLVSSRLFQGDARDSNRRLCVEMLRCCCCRCVCVCVCAGVDVDHWKFCECMSVCVCP